jgi:hypothetical protein
MNRLEPVVQGPVGRLQAPGREAVEQLDQLFERYAASTG